MSEKVLIEALKVIKQEMVNEMNRGIENAEPHEFSPEFEERMNQLLQMEFDRVQKTK